MKKKTNVIAKMFAVLMVAMILLPVLISSGQSIVGYVDKQYYQPWKQQKDAEYMQVKSDVIELYSQYQ